MDLPDLGPQPFTARDAYDGGLTATTLHQLCREGRLRRLVRGVYVDAARPDSLELRCSALRLVIPDGAVVTDRTAGWLHGAPMVMAPDSDLDVPLVSAFHRSRGGRLRNDVAASGQRMMPDSDVVEVHGLLVTTPLRTALDLGRLLHRDQAFAALDAMLRLGVDREELLEQTERFRGYRGIRQCRALAPLADGRSQSQGESVLRLRWYDCGNLPRPELQVEVQRWDGGSFFVDLGVPELRFGAEYDGEAFHADEDQEHDSSRRSWLDRSAGWTIRAFRRGHVFGVRRTVEIGLRAGLREARVRARRTA